MLNLLSTIEINTSSIFEPIASKSIISSPQKLPITKLDTQEKEHHPDRGSAVPVSTKIELNSHSFNRNKTLLRNIQKPKTQNHSNEHSDLLPGLDKKSNSGKVNNRVKTSYYNHDKKDDVDYDPLKFVSLIDKQRLSKKPANRILSKMSPQNTEKQYRKPPSSPTKQKVKALIHSPEIKKNTKIGDYIILKDIGRGTFGVVKLGEHIPSKRRVAIKVINKSTIKNSKCKQRVEKELRLFPLLRHPHIVRVFDVIETNDSFMIVMEHLENGELLKFVNNRRRLSEQQARYFFRQIISAVDYCHQNFIIHRDLKPENMLLDSKFQIRLIDFGFANFYYSDQKQATFCGSPYYASPEMVKGVEYSGPEVDIWSLGVTLYSLLSGKLPFNAYNTKDFLKKVSKGDYEMPPYFSPVASDLVSKMLTVDTQKRISLDKIRCHKWTNISYLDLPDSHLQIRPLVVRNPNEQHLKVMSKYGFSPKETKEKLLDPTSTHPSKSLYHLLREAKKKKNNTESCRNNTKVTANISQPTETVKSNFDTPSSPLFAAREDPEPEESTNSRRFSDDTIMHLKAEEQPESMFSNTSIKEARRSFDSISRRSSILKNKFNYKDSKNCLDQQPKIHFELRNTIAKENKWFSGLFNVTATSSKPLTHIKQELNRVLELHNIHFDEQESLYVCGSKITKAIFEIRIKQKDNTNEYVLNFKNIKGSSWSHKKMAYKLINRMFI